MVFLFIIYLSFIALFVLPFKVSMEGFFDKAKKQSVFALRVGAFEKTFNNKKDEKDQKKHIGQKAKTARFPVKIRISQIPFYVVKEIRISLTLPPQNADRKIYLYFLNVLNAVIPIKTDCYDGDKYYFEITIKIAFNLLNIIPVLKRILLQKGV